MAPDRYAPNSFSKSCIFSLISRPTSVSPTSLRSATRLTTMLSEWISLSFSMAASVDSKGSWAARIRP